MAAWATGAVPPAPLTETSMTLMTVIAPVIVAAFFALQGCGVRSSEGRLHNVFGEDDRVALDQHDRKWTAIGKIFNTGCSGTMVGRDIVLTAAHCVIDPATKQISTNLTWYRPDYVNGTAPVESRIDEVWPGTLDPTSDTGRDWAILRLRDPIGEKVGWIDVNFTDTMNFPDKLTVAGYSTDFQGGEVAGLHVDCDTRGRFPATNLIFHDCDLTRGSSGGPALTWFLGSVFVTGVNIAERRENGDVSLHVDAYDDEHANVVIPTQGFYNFLKQQQILALVRDIN